MTAPPNTDPPVHAEAARDAVRRALRPVVPAAPARRAGKRVPGWMIAALLLLMAAGAASLVAGFYRRAGVPLADEPALLKPPGEGLLVFRLKPAPKVTVLVFSSLTLQGHMLNRIGAFVEKAGMPRDRVVSEAELGAAIAKSHDSVETFYYGHDYRAADLARFFATAAAGHVALRPEEIALRGILQREGMLKAGAVGALISVPPPEADGILDAQGRAAILRHEVSHGVYFTDPVYAAYVRHFWNGVMTDAERQKFRRFLGADGYDTGNDDLVRNETQAYLVFTPDRRFFNAGAVWMTQSEIDALRQSFLLSMPDGWLRDRQLSAPGAWPR